jgi:Na+-driven multidrug efflux pump
LQRFDRSIVDGPLVPAVWKLAWPTMLQNVIAGLQGIIDHVMVGHYVGFTANAAIGVSWSRASLEPGNRRRSTASCTRRF